MTRLLRGGDDWDFDKFYPASCTDCSDMTNRTQEANGVPLRKWARNFVLDRSKWIDIVEDAVP